jgi:hypothetical protein
MSTAKKLVTIFEEKDSVYEAKAVSHTTVVVVEKAGNGDDSKTFFDAAGHGWRLGLMVPRSSGNVFIFVKMEGHR